MKSVNLTESASAEESIKLHEVARTIYKSKKTIVLTGAGISCNAGIPDFRSDDGLYNIVKQKYPNAFIKGQDLFDISLFRDTLTLSIFCTFMEGLYKHSLSANATETHRFIRTLKERNKLLRCYTQNIDSIEKSIDLHCGIDSAHINELDTAGARLFRENWKNLDVVQLHGNLHKLACTHCFAHYDWTPEWQQMLRDGVNPECTNCHSKYQERLYSGKRLTGTIGVLRPDIVLYGENHPQSELLAKGLNIDLAMKSDCVLIMGTSLKVDGVKKLVRSLAKAVHSRGGKVIFVNKSPLPKAWASVVDYEVLCDCDVFVRHLKREIPDLFLTQEQLDSKKLRNTSKTLKTIKQEVLLDIKNEAYMHIKYGPLLCTDRMIKKEEEEPETLLTPPCTPSKKRSRSQASNGKQKPALKRVKKVKKEPLPSPTPSFCGNGTTGQDELATNTDNDDGDESPLQSFSESQLNRSTKVKKEVSL